MTDAAHPDWIVDTSDETFERDVIERSKTTPVVLDFWATWCQPCLMLKPLLEQLANEYQGRFVLAKAEQPANGKALAEFRVEAFPTVFGLAGGQPIDYFVGVLRPAQLRQWIDRLIEQAELLKAEQLEETDPETAEAEYRQTLDAAPDNERAQIGLARVLLQLGKREESQQLIARLEARGYLEPDAERVKAALDLAGAGGGNLSDLRQRIDENPRDFASRVELAQALAAKSQYDEALNLALEVVEEDLTGAGDSARRLMLEIFQVLPDDSPLKTSYQRKLSAALY